MSSVSARFIFNLIFTLLFLSYYDFHINKEAALQALHSVPSSGNNVMRVVRWEAACLSIKLLNQLKKTCLRNDGIDIYISKQFRMCYYVHILKTILTYIKNYSTESRKILLQTNPQTGSIMKTKHKVSTFKLNKVTITTFFKVGVNKMYYLL